MHNSIRTTIERHFCLHLLTTILTMIKIILLIIATVLLSMTTDHCQAWNDTDSSQNHNETFPSKPVKPFVYHGRYHRRIRRQDAFGSDTASTVLSILPLDRIGTIVGQIMATGLKEMLNPDVGKKLVNVIENQAPLLLTSLFTNLYSNLRGPPVRSSNTTTSSSSAVVINNNAVKQLSNSSTSSLMEVIRRPGTK